MLRNTILFTLLICIYSSAFAQDIDYLRDVGSLADGADYHVSISGSDMISDDEGNRYITGRYEEGLFPFAQENEHPVLQAEERSNNYFISKIDQNGELIWTKKIFSEDLSVEGLPEVVTGFTDRTSRLFLHEDHVFLTGTYKNQIRVDEFESDYDSTYATNTYIINLDTDGVVEYLFTAENFSDIGSSDGVYDLIFRDDGKMYASLSLRDSLLIDGVMIYGKQHPDNSSRESLIVELDFDTGALGDYVVMASTTGNGLCKATKLYQNDDGDLYAIGMTTRGVSIGDNFSMTSPHRGAMFIVKFEEEIDERPENVVFGYTENSSFLFVEEFAVIENNKIAFSGFFRGEKMSLFGTELVGVEDRFNMFVGVMDLDEESCILFPYGNVASSYSPKVDLASDGDRLYVISRLSVGTAELLESTVTIDTSEWGSLLLATIDINDYSYSLTHLPAIPGTEWLSIDARDGDVNISADYEEDYSYGDIDLTAEYVDVWFTSVSNLSTSSHDEKAVETIVYPNPTSGTLFVDRSDFDKIVISDLQGLAILEIRGQSRSIDLQSLIDGIYFMSIFDGEQLLDVHKVVVVGKGH